MNQLLTPVRIGRYVAPNRLVMAPMTRSRADGDGVPSDLTVPYYAQRASAGLIVTEGLFPSAMGKGYVHTPGIETEAQVAAWKEVTEAVHARGGRIFMQLMHCGRVPDLPERFHLGAALNAPDRNTFFAPPTAQGYIDYPTLAVAEAA